jgi:riboflavin synthase
VFTGLVEGMGEVERPGPRVRIRADLALAVGDSVAVDGCCLTVVAAGDGWFEADAVPETLRRTTLGRRGPGDRVNLERPLRADGRLGGHFVQGHVDGVGRVAGRRAEGDSLLLDFTAGPELLRYVAEKGSIAVDGVSLTVAARLQGGFRVAVIPHTAAATTLGSRLTGDEVNLEADVLAKYVEGLLAAGQRPDGEAGA